jgi:hypothetical protein
VSVLASEAGGRRCTLKLEDCPGFPKIDKWAEHVGSRRRMRLGAELSGCSSSRASAPDAYRIFAHLTVEGKELPSNPTPTEPGCEVSGVVGQSGRPQLNDGPFGWYCLDAPRRSCSQRSTALRTSAVSSSASSGRRPSAIGNPVTAASRGPGGALTDPDRSRRAERRVRPFSPDRTEPVRRLSSSQRA